MSNGVSLKMWACLGDALTSTPAESPTTLLSSWPSRVDLKIWPTRGASNHGVKGSRLAVDVGGTLSMRKRFELNISDRGYYGLVLWGGIEDILADESGPDVFADYKAIVDLALAEKFRVVAVITPPAGGYSGWSPSRQAALESFRASVLGLAGSNPNLEIVDLYAAAPEGLGDPDAPTMLNPAYKGVADDGLHYGQLAQDEVVFPKLLALMGVADGVLPHTVGGKSRPVVQMKVGNTIPILVALLVDDDGDPIDLTDASVTFRMRSRYGGDLKIDAQADVADPVTAEVQYVWRSADVGAAGVFKAEFAVRIEGRDETVPSSGTFTVIFEEGL